MRRFADKPVPRDHLETLVDACH